MSRKPVTSTMLIGFTVNAGGIRTSRTAALLSTTDVRPGPSPPNHALTSTAGKNVIYGMFEPRTGIKTMRNPRLSAELANAIP
jgi:hypothetical protein